MHQAIQVFVVGIAGVFTGMGMLYIAIRVLALIVDRFGANRRA